MTYGSLFSGFGGIDLGLDRAGWQCKWQVEIDSYASKVLNYHWAHVLHWNDVRTFLSGPRFNLSDFAVDAICGGFPCQDISQSGPRNGIVNGARSGLWAEYLRIIGLLRPRVVVVENVAALLVPIVKDGVQLEPAPIGRVLGDLAAIGYDAEWEILSACQFGAPHPRERLFIVAYPNDKRLEVFGPSETSAEALPQRFSTAAKLPILPSVWDETQLETFGLADEVPNHMAGWRGFGNAVLPDIAEWIAKRIDEAERLTKCAT